MDARCSGWNRTLFESGFQQRLEVGRCAVAVPENSACGINQDDPGVFVGGDAEVAAPLRLVLREDDELILLRNGKPFAHAAFDGSSNEAGGSSQHGNFVHGYAGQCGIGSSMFDPLAAGWSGFLAETRFQQRWMSADGLGQNDVVTAERFAWRGGHGLRIGCNRDGEHERECQCGEEPVHAVSRLLTAIIDTGEVSGATETPPRRAARRFLPIVRN